MRDNKALHPTLRPSGLRAGELNRYVLKKTGTFYE